MLEIILAIQDDDDRSMVENLYVKYEKKMRAIAYKILQNDFDAQDCVNETILRIIDSLELYREKSDDEIAKLLSITCKNTAINIYRKKSRHNSNTLSLNYNYTDNEDFGGIELVDINENVERIIVNEYTKNLVAKLIDELDIKYKHILILKYQYMMSTSQISKIMGISETTVTTRIMRAKQYIMQKGGQELYELYKN